MLYQEELMDHYKYPRNNKTIENPDFAISELNPSCGDRIAIAGKISENIISDLGFSGSGCVISQATASMLTEHCLGKTVELALGLSKNDIIAMVGLEMGPTRLKCALLSLQVLQHGLLSLQETKGAL
jgi:nitrogen fixation NifU-like protein